MLNEAKTSRPRPKPRDRDQSYEVEAEAENNYEKSTKMINNIRFKIIAGKINKMSRILHNFCPKMPDYIIRQRDRGQAEAKCLRPRPKLRGQGQNFGLETTLASRT